MDEELSAAAPGHEPVTQDAAQQVAEKAAAGVTPGRMPAVYLGHGAPPLVDDPLWVAQLEGWARALPRPRAILMVSAHWESAPLSIGATRDGVPLVYDFGGFPERYYHARYPAPAARTWRHGYAACCRAPSPLPTSRTVGSTTAPTCRSPSCTRTRTSRCCRFPCRPWIPSG